MVWDSNWDMSQIVLSHCPGLYTSFGTVGTHPYRGVPLSQDWEVGLYTLLTHASAREIKSMSSTPIGFAPPIRHVLAEQRRKAAIHAVCGELADMAARGVGQAVRAQYASDRAEAHAEWDALFPDPWRAARAILAPNKSERHSIDGQAR